MKWALALTCLATASCLSGQAATDVVVDMTGVVLVDGGNAFQSAPFPTHDAHGNLVAASPGWTSFHGRETLRFLFTPLPHPPTHVEIWLSFDGSGIGGAPAAGDLAHVQALDAVDPIMSDEASGTIVSDLAIYNATEQDYFVRVVVE